MSGKSFRKQHWFSAAGAARRNYINCCFYPIPNTAALWCILLVHFILKSFEMQINHSFILLFSFLLPPRVAETRKWVPYFLMRFSLICCRVGRRPSNRRLRRNSGAKGKGDLRKSLFSVARLFTFQWLNSLKRRGCTMILKLNVCFIVHISYSVDL